MSYSRRFSYQPCDSFFVESAYDDFPAPRLSAKEHAKLIARERQYAIAEELSKITSQELRHDILSHLLEMDVSAVGLFLLAKLFGLTLFCLPQTATLADVESIDIQTEIQWFMRPYLLDFLIEAHAAFQLLPTTLFLAINLLDRYCSKRVVYKRHYQLVGCAALLIAAKYGDKKDCVPTIKELKSMCCSLYDDDMFVQMEWHVLQTLGWVVGHPTVDSFLQIAVMDSPQDREVEHMALYVLEIALFHREFVSKRSSDLARASLALSRCILGHPQPRNTEWAAQYDPLTLVGLSQQLHQPSQVLYRKYSSGHFSRVSRLLEQFLIRQAEIACTSLPSPPSDIPACSSSKPYQGPVGLSTPQKPHPAPHGYMTPPITPENESFTHAVGDTSKYARTMASGAASPSPSPCGQYFTPHVYEGDAVRVTIPQQIPEPPPQMGYYTTPY